MILLCGAFGWRFRRYGNTVELTIKKGGHRFLSAGLHGIGDARIADQGKHDNYDATIIFARRASSGSSTLAGWPPGTSIQPF